MATLAKTARKAADSEAKFNAAWQALFVDTGNDDLYVGRSPYRMMPPLKAAAMAVRTAWVARVGKEGAAGR